MGCGSFLMTGNTYLLFLDAGGKPIQGAYLDGDDFRSMMARERRKILRQYRDRLIDDLSGPWRFMDTGISCSVNHEFQGGVLSFSFGYYKGDLESITLVPTVGPNGEITFDPAPAPAWLKERSPMTFTGPQYERGDVIFTIRLRDLETDFEASASIRIDDRFWPLYRRTMVTERPNSSPHTFVTQVTGGATVLELLDAMSHPTDVIISAIPTDRPTATLNKRPERAAQSPIFFSYKHNPVP